MTADFDGNGTATVVTHYGCGFVTQPNVDAFGRGLVAAAALREEFSRQGLSRAIELDWQALASQIEDRTNSDDAAVTMQDGRVV